MNNEGYKIKVAVATVLIWTAITFFVGLRLANAAVQYSKVFVDPVSQVDGDTITTAQVAVGVCPGASCPTLISAAVTDSTLRRRLVQNMSPVFDVYIGSQAVNLVSAGYRLTISTAGAPVYETYGTGAIYGTASSTSTVAVLTQKAVTP